MKCKFVIFLFLVAPLQASAAIMAPRVSLETYGGVHITTVEESNTGFNKQFIDLLSIIQFDHSSLLNDELTVSEHLSFDISNDTSSLSPYEAFVSLDKELYSIKVGVIDVGGRDGIVQGHRYMTQTGGSYSGTYGNNDHSQPNLALVVRPLEKVDITLAYSSRLEDISTQTSQDMGNVSVLNLFAAAETSVINLALEVETKAYEDNNQNVNAADEKNDPKKSEQFFGFGFSANLVKKMVVPFFNFGVTNINNLTTGKIDATQEMNIGVDTLLTRRLGGTLAIEQLRKDSAESRNMYLGLSYEIGESAAVGFGYWESNQKVSDGFDNLKNRIDLELSYTF